MPEPDRSRSRTRRSASLAPLLLLVACSQMPRDGGAGAGVASATPARRGLLIVGIDSASWDVIAEIETQGVALPALAALREQGVRARLRTLTPTLSPNIWTTIATGRLPEVHGIQSFQTRQVVATPVGSPPATAAPDRAMVTSASRKVRALWEIAAERGRPADVLGWWVTWPADGGAGGAMVSDRYQQASLPTRVWPEALEAEVDRLLAEATPEKVRGPVLGKAANDETRRYVARFAASDWVLAELGRRRLAERGDSIVMVYLRGLDPVSHRFWKHWKPEGYGLPPGAVAAAGMVVPDYYRFVDRLIGELAAARGDRPMILVSDHGMSGILGTPALLDMGKLLARLALPGSPVEGDFLSTESTVLLRGLTTEHERRLALPRVARLDAPLLQVRRLPDGALRVAVERRARPDDAIQLGAAELPLHELTSLPPTSAHSGVHEDAPDGLFLMAGGGARAGAEAAPLSVTDVAPLALALLGLPAAADMPGSVPAELFAAPPAPLARVATYDATPRPTGAAPHVPGSDAALEDELRGLGYLGK